jgi:hypothetical protein
MTAKVERNRLIFYDRSGRPIGSFGSYAPDGHGLYRLFAWLPEARPATTVYRNIPPRHWPTPHTVPQNDIYVSPDSVCFFKSP